MTYSVEQHSTSGNLLLFMYDAETCILLFIKGKSWCVLNVNWRFSAHCNRSSSGVAYSTVVFQCALSQTSRFREYSTENYIKGMGGGGRTGRRKLDLFHLKILYPLVLLRASSYLIIIRLSCGLKIPPEKRI